MGLTDALYFMRVEFCVDYNKDLIIVNINRQSQIKKANPKAGFFKE